MEDETIKDFAVGTDSAGTSIVLAFNIENREGRFVHTMSPEMAIRLAKHLDALGEKIQGIHSQADRT